MTSSSGAPRRAAVVGGGLAGLVAARALAERGVEVTLYDKGSRPGGRASSRERASSSFDHGAQYFTCRDPEFREQVDGWLARGRAALWAGRIAEVERGEVRLKPENPDRFVGSPTMGTLASDLADGAIAAGVRTVFGVRVGAIVREVIAPGASMPEYGAEARRQGGDWRLDASDGLALGRFESVVVAVPPEQAALLLTASPDLAEVARSVEMLPCWAAMVEFSEPIEVEFDGAFVSDSPLAWIARDSSKPGRSPGERWVLHATPRATRDRLPETIRTASPAASPGAEMPELRDEVAADLLAHFFEAVGLPPRESRSLTGHLWRFSIAADPSRDGFLWDAERSIGACGDWLHGSRVEGAFLSGLRLGRAMLGG